MKNGIKKILIISLLRSVYSKIGIGVLDGGDRRVVATVFMN